MLSTADYLSFVDEALDDMAGVVTELGDELANRRPDLPDANAPFAILTHCLGVMEYWAGHVVAGRTVHRDRPAEFRAAGRVADLRDQVRAQRARFADDVARADPFAPPRGEVAAADAALPLGRTQGGALLHVYAELAQHRGQLEMTRDLLLADRSTWGSSTAEVQQLVGPGPTRRPDVPVVMIREAADEDWPLIFPTFAAIVADGRTYAYPDHLSSDEARSIWMEKPPGRTVVAVEGERVLGSAKMGPSRPGRGSHVATASFMVDPAHHGRGIGRALGEHVVAWARSAGFRSIQFNAVVETNHPAVHLWQSLGFTILCTVPRAFDHPEHGLVGLHVMFHDLTPHSTPPPSSVVDR